MCVCSRALNLSSAMTGMQAPCNVPRAGSTTILAKHHSLRCKTATSHTCNSLEENNAGEPFLCIHSAGAVAGGDVEGGAHRLDAPVRQVVHHLQQRQPAVSCQLTTLCRPATNMPLNSHDAWASCFVKANLVCKMCPVAHCICRMGQLAQPHNSSTLYTPPWVAGETARWTLRTLWCRWACSQPRQRPRRS